MIYGYSDFKGTEGYPIVNMQWQIQLLITGKKSGICIKYSYYVISSWTSGVSWPAWSKAHERERRYIITLVMGLAMFPLFFFYSLYKI